LTESHIQRSAKNIAFGWFDKAVALFEKRKTAPIRGLVFFVQSDLLSVVIHFLVSTSD